MTDALPMPHPEVAIGIPARLVCVKPHYRGYYARILGYRGPLTLSEAVEQGRVSVAEAVELVYRWERATNRQFAEMPAPEIGIPAVLR